MRDDKACDGGQTLTDGDFEECLKCGLQIRGDLVGHSFWGFQNCREKSQPLAEAHVGGATTGCVTKADEDSSSSSSEGAKEQP